MTYCNDLVRMITVAFSNEEINPESKYPADPFTRRIIFIDPLSRILYCTFRSYS